MEWRSLSGEFMVAHVENQWKIMYKLTKEIKDSEIVCHGIATKIWFCKFKNEGRECIHIKFTI